MIKLLFPLPRRIVVATSGGVDSMAVLDFLSRKHDVACAFFNHGTETSKKAFDFLSKYCGDKKIPMYYGNISVSEKPKKLSYEEFWRIERYKYLDRIETTWLEPAAPIITAHHLDDCVETYIWSCMHGKPKLPQFNRGKIYRPFLTTRKEEFVNWCKKKNVPWCEDVSNLDNSFTRNYIRNELMPHALKVNPGLHKVVKKLVEQDLIVEKIKNPDRYQFEPSL